MEIVSNAEAVLQYCGTYVEGLCHMAMFAKLSWHLLRLCHMTKLYYSKVVLQM